jgi:NADH dehydrogenase
MPDRSGDEPLSAHRIVIVGGGAGGLELATRLGDRLGPHGMRGGRAEITLVDRSPTHIWKPMLHQVAAGSLDPEGHALDYLAQARWHHFRFRRGEMAGLDRKAREVELGPLHDDEGTLVVPARRIAYDTLVIAIGSQVNDFGTPGAAEHAISLDAVDDARRFHRRLINACMRANDQQEPLRPEQLSIAIIGAGATGVELAAELHHSTRELIAFGMDRLRADRDIRVTLVEAGPRVLPALPEKLSEGAEALLRELRIDVRTGERVTALRADGIETASGLFVPAEIAVWAAGIRAPAFLATLDGLEVNRLNQLVVEPSLATTRDPNIFAFGDCASCPWLGQAPAANGAAVNVPPRAQAAHQQADTLYRNLVARLDHRPLRAFRYRDFGSLVSLGEHSTVGSLMGTLVGGRLFVEGLFARMMYISLHKMHEYALHGAGRVAMDTLARLFARSGEPRVKLH